MSFAISSVFTVRETTALFYLDIPNIPPTVADVEADKKNEQKAGCETPTGHYNDGDVYSSNSTGIRPTSDNQCVMCVCQVICYSIYQAFVLFCVVIYKTVLEKYIKPTSLIKC